QSDWRIYKLVNMELLGQKSAGRRIMKFRRIPLVFALFFCITDAEHWTKLREKHKSKSLTTQRLRRAVDLGSDMQTFKRDELKPLLIERVPGTPGNLAAQEHIRQRMQRLKWSIEEFPFTAETPFGDKPFNNIVATQNPSAKRRLAFVCHFDSKYYRNIKFIGATDSSVPCAMMLDLARTLNDTIWKDAATALDVSLQLIFLDGEEAFVHWTSTDSVYGARYLAQKWHDEKYPEQDSLNNVLDRLDAFILLDLIGTKNPKFTNWFDKQTGHLFERLAKIETKLKKDERYHGTTSYFQNKARYNGGGIEDDHIPFLRKDVPILHLIAYPFPSVWHKESDNENALDYDTIENLNHILRIFTIEYLHLSP
ncbi:unnamed protein product, partial [Owenia fusiformis]